MNARTLLQAEERTLALFPLPPRVDALEELARIVPGVPLAFIREYADARGIDEAEAIARLLRIAASRVRATDGYAKRLGKREAETT